MARHCLGSVFIFLYSRTQLVTKVAYFGLLSGTIRSLLYLADNIEVSGKSLWQWYLISVLPAWYVLPQHRMLFKEQVSPVFSVLSCMPKIIQVIRQAPCCVCVYIVLSNLWEGIIFTSPKHSFFIGIISPELWCCGKTTYFPHWTNDQKSWSQN